MQYHRTVGPSDELRKYSYVPLDAALKQIRLLYLDTRPSIEANTPLRYKLRHASLLEEPVVAYYAISYCWGEQARSTTVFLDEAPFEIPSSAEQALRGTSSIAGDVEMPMWIDALCIDQDNLTEKGHQVAMMGEVYSSASEVRVWLGEQDDTTRFAIHGINTVVDFYSESSDTAKPMLSRSMSDFRQVYLGNIDWQSVHRFLNLPWFSRLWPVQEVVLAKNVQMVCGNQSLSWERLAQFVKILSKHGLSPLTDAIYLDGGRGILNVGAVDQIQRGDRSLSTLLIRTLAFKVSDPRDKIYAIFGLLGENGQSNEIKNRLDPDYYIEKKDLFIRATSLAMEASRSLRLLRYAQVMAPANRLVLDEESGSLVDNEEFPSWVPRYDLARSNSRGSPSMVRDRGKGVDLSIAPTIRFQGVNLEQLCAHGVRVGMIASSATSSDNFVGCESKLPTTAEEFLVSSLRNLWDTDNGVVWTKQFIKELAFTFLMGGSNSDASSKTVDDFEAMVWKYQDDIANHSPWHRYESLSDALPPFPRGNAEAYIESAKNHVINRAVFLDTNRKPGLGQQYQRPGDELCILFGCSVPLILRREGYAWRLIGDAYISGVMRGEYIQMLQQQSRLEAETREYVIH